MQVLSVKFFNNNQHLHLQNENSRVKPNYGEDNPTDMTQNQYNEDYQAIFDHYLDRSGQIDMLHLLHYIQVGDITHQHQLYPNDRHTPFPNHRKDDKPQLCRNCHNINVY